MRVLVLFKGDASSEAGALPDEKFIGEMLKYNAELLKAGVLLVAEGSSRPRRARG